VLKCHGILYANKYQQIYQQISKHCFPKYSRKSTARDVSRTKPCTELTTHTNTVTKAKSNFTKASKWCIQILLTNSHIQKSAAYVSASHILTQLLFAFCPGKVRTWFWGVTSKTPGNSPLRTLLYSSRSRPLVNHPISSHSTLPCKHLLTQEDDAQCAVCPKYTHIIQGLSPLASAAFFVPFCFWLVVSIRYATMLT